MILKGLKFGMILQLAVGPMCLLVFNSSAKSGLLIGLSLVCAIALVDLLFISLSGLGISAVLSKPHISLIVKLFGALVLVIFGLNMSLSAFDLSLLPNINIFKDITANSIFVQGLLLTASNPLTIVFWSGVFTTQIIENNYNRRQLIFFGAGCVLSTLIFLSFVALLGTVLKSFLSDGIINVLNLFVGVLIIFFGIKLFLKRSVNNNKSSQT